MARAKRSAKYPLIDLDLRVGLAVRRLRQVRQMTQSDLAQSAGISQASVSMTENGLRNTRFNLVTLQKMAYALGENRLSDLIRFAEDVPTTSEILVDADKYVSKRGHYKRG